MSGSERKYPRGTGIKIAAHGDSERYHVRTPVGSVMSVPALNEQQALELAANEYSTVEMMPDGRFDADALAGDWNGWLMLGVVDPAWRGRGIGSDLFERHGFTPVQRFEDYYAAEGDRSSCPDCGIWRGDDGVCSCETTFWALDVTSGNAPSRSGGSDE